mgnify:CR=1 FL=1
MPNNNTEATTYIKFGAQASPTFSYLNDASGNAFAANFNSSYSDQDQIEVLRGVAWLPADGAEPTAEELKTVYILPHANKSGSPMYSINETDKTITFITENVTTEYDWIDGQHHNRGTGNVTLASYTHGDIITIRRKTDVNKPGQQWTTGSKITATRLNSQFTQLLNLSQEIRSFVLNPLDFDTYIGQKNGVCPLDGNKKVPLRHIPASLGGSEGEASADLSDNSIGELSNVSSTAATATTSTLVYDTGTNKWTPKTTLDNVIDISSAVDGQIVQWDDGNTKWSLANFALGTMTDTTIASSLNAGEILQYRAGSTNSWVNSGGATPTDGQILAWDAATTRWEPITWDGTVTADALSGHSLSELGDMTYPGAYDWEENDFMAYFSDPQFFRPKSVDIYDLNDVKYAGQNPLIADGNWLVMDNSIRKTDDSSNGCWAWGAPFYLTEGIDLDNPAHQGVIKYTNQDGLTLEPLNVNHLGDVLAQTSQMDEGYMLVYSKDDETWYGQDPNSGLVGATGGSTGGGIVEVTATYDGGIPLGEYYQTYVVRQTIQPIYWYIFAVTADDGVGEYQGTQNRALEWEIKIIPASGGAFADFDHGWAGVNFEGGAQTWFDLNGGDRFSTSNNHAGMRTKKIVAEGGGTGASDRENWYTHDGDSVPGDYGKLYEGDILVFKPTRWYVPNSNPMHINMIFQEVEA